MMKFPQRIFELISHLQILFLRGLGNFMLVYVITFA